MRLLAASCLALSLVAGLATAPVRAQEIAGNAAVTGAGSTFAFPIISKWAVGYQRWKAGGGDYPAPNSGLEDPPAGPVLDYEPSGSLAGTMRAREGAVDFGASDAPLNSAELAKLGLGQFPIVIGGVVAVVNLPGVAPGEIKFTGPLLADIFLGKVSTWSDPAIKAINPTLKLPDAPIAVVRRSDGSGTTFNFTAYLSRVSPDWKDKVGSDLLVKWPVGAAAKGNDGMAQTVKQTANAIGYVEFAQALQAKLSYASIQNRAGQFIKPEPLAFQAAASSATWSGTTDFDQLLVDAPGETAYPMVVTVFAQMKKSGGSQRSRATLNFLQWALERGAADAAHLGYVPLPSSLVSDIKAYWATSFKFSS
ncbi:phosphate ABC transporter substrate-binding protein PstS [Bradyrhizobium sp. LHD-71]|uniref:phosphate ABC transporter substrate-binding protein PstS n=1 Tax=Bradyrhizobium sp. LHD-71 TaxID=3072141 RepID=UPI00280CECBF|nr:phosphate ABC transporter substrate-binding protein PstS [Bradyrhizobium sp. LHD-71]MDQ8726619.1 phosphate ABC transporter substrate-binding protein PstS [Bradyrhizobium sp. LHD-71]